jgi:hypothetical protein
MGPRGSIIPRRCSGASFGEHGEHSHHRSPARRRPDGTASGYEGLLAEQHYFMLAAITGFLGCELSVDGLRMNPTALAVTSDRRRSLPPNFARMVR